MMTENDYLKWLIKLVERRENKKYIDLLEWLFYQNFYSILPNDDNRAADGIALRSEFGIQLDRECSILEMLIALARRMDYYLEDLIGPPNVKNYFWRFIENLNLDLENEDYNYLIITRFLERRYERNGNGGIFPLKRYRKDQRDVEIWYQMMAYINELS